MQASPRIRAGIPGPVSAPLIAVAAAVVAAIASLAIVRRTRAEHRAVVEAQRPLLEAAHQKARAAGLHPEAHAGVDDLKVIEGIGPRAEAALTAAGIETYAQLADLRPGRLRTILKAAGGRMSDSRTWPAQARLAADGEWEALARLQQRLSRGRTRRRV